MLDQDGVVDTTASRWGPESDEEYEAALAELKRRFSAWVSESDDAVDPDAPEGLLHYKWGYVDGHLTRWTRRDLDEIYLELCPAKVMAGPDELDEVLAEAAMFVTYLSETGLADEESEPADVLVEHLARIEGRLGEHGGHLAPQLRQAPVEPSRHRACAPRRPRGGRGLHGALHRPTGSGAGRDPSWKARVREVPATTGSVHASGDPTPAKLTQAPSTGAERPGSAGQ